MPNQNLLSKPAQDAIITALSTARLQPYLEAVQGQTGVAIKIYELNLQLCSAIYPSLNIFEVTFRNQIDSVLQNKYGENWYQGGNLALKNYESELIAKAEKNLQKNHKQLTRDSIFTELTLGFWSAFILNKDYKTSVFDQCIKQIFPAAQPKERNFNQITRDFKNNLLYFRNRVFHHEPIWPIKYQVQKKHEYLCKVLGWMNPEVFSWLQTFDNFPEVYKSVSDQLFLTKAKPAPPILKDKNSHNRKIPKP